MVSFIRKRLQVFVSSTFSDLIQERQAAVEAILTVGHIPAGMELFASGDESQMEVIKQWIDESDIYLLILGGRYGSVEPISGKSYTQLEYEYALGNSKPCFACVVENAAQEERIKRHGSSVIETDYPNKLREFRELVLTKVIKFWRDHKDIKIIIGETLSQFSRRDDLVGWVRADTQANTVALADEVVRLSRENAQLRDQIKYTKSDIIVNGLTFDQMISALHKDNQISPLLIYRRKLLMDGILLEGRYKDLDMDILLIRGIVNVEYSLGVGYSNRHYSLTDDGRAFLNRFDVENPIIGNLAW